MLSSHPGLAYSRLPKIRLAEMEELIDISVVIKCCSFDWWNIGVT